MRDRLAAETAEEREVRLHCMSILQHETMTVETSDERDVQLQHASQRKRKNCTRIKQSSQLHN